MQLAKQEWLFWDVSQTRKENTRKFNFKDMQKLSRKV